MRTEKEIMELILTTAREDIRIKAVILQGSRTNCNIAKDIFQDYDIVYVVDETKPYYNDKTWINRFGKCMYMQYPEDCSEYACNIDQSYGWLMQFQDGVRIDLHVCILSYALQSMKEDHLQKVLLDKINCLPIDYETSDHDYWIKQPTEKRFYDTCNEFWWCFNNVAKGLWRMEITYVMDQLNQHIRPCCFQMLEWIMGYNTAFQKSAGKSGKWLPQYISNDLWNRYLRTFSNAEISAIWESIWVLCDLFNEIATTISQHLQIPYHEDEARQSEAYLHHVANLACDAIVIYE